MKHTLGTSLALVAVGAVLAGTGTAAAATGGTFLLGKDNTADKPTILRNSSAAPNLTLPAARAGQAPLAVSPNSGKVANFNADKLDGLDSTLFALAAGGGVGSIDAMGGPLDYDGDEVPDDEDQDGVPDEAGAYAECPTGTKLTGGGHAVLHAAGAEISVPFENGWLVSTTPVLGEEDLPLFAVAQCYNPRGPVEQSVSSLGQSASGLDDAAKARLRQLHARR